MYDESDCYDIESYFLTTPARAFEGLWWAFLFFFLTGCIGTIYNCDLRRSFREVMDERGASPFIPSADEMLYAALLAVVMKRVFARGGLIQPQTWITNEQHLAQRVWNLLRVYISSIQRIDNRSTLWCTNYTWCLFIIWFFLGFYMEWITFVAGTFFELLFAPKWRRWPADGRTYNTSPIILYIKYFKRNKRWKLKPAGNGFIIF
jgi:hypothetical protein